MRLPCSADGKGQGPSGTILCEEDPEKDEQGVSRELLWKKVCSDQRTSLEWDKERVCLRKPCRQHSDTEWGKPTLFQARYSLEIRKIAS